MLKLTRSIGRPAALRGIRYLSLLCLLAATPSSAQISWEAIGGGAWGEALNWNPHEVPDRAGESAVVGLSGAYTIYVDAGYWPDRVDITNPAVVLSIMDWGGLSGNGAGIFNHGTIRSQARHCGLGGTIVNMAGGSILIPSGTTLSFSGSIVSNEGTIRVNSDHGLDTAVLQMDDGDGMDISGTGQLLLLGDGDPARAEIASYQGTPWTQRFGHSIRGDGAISATFNNEGLISADVPGRTIALTGNGKNNSGIMEARDGAVLDVGVRVIQTSAGLIRADNGTVRLLSGARIDNGTIATPNGGRFESRPGTTILCVATNDGDLDVLGGSRMVAGLDMLTNNGTINLNPQGMGDDAVIVGYQYHNMTFGGTGQIVMRTAGDISDARIETTGETIVNGPLHTIRGEGSITCPFDNHGHISADVPARTFLLVGGVKNNDGLLDAQGQGILELAGTQVIQSGAGAVAADGGTVRLTNGASILNGSVITTGAGRIESQSGTTGLYELTTTGTVDVLGGSTLVAGYDFLTNNGTITLNPAQAVDDAVIRGFPNHNVTLQGTGQIVMRTAGDVSDARVETTGETVINGSTHAIRGEGSVTCPFVNHGLISADAPARALRLVGGAKDNDGVIEARNQGLIEIGDTWVRQSGSGVIQADGGAVRLRNGGFIRNGALTSTNGGRFETEAGASGIYDLTNNAEIDVMGGSTLIAGWSAVVNNGTIHLNPAQSSTDAVLACCEYCNVTFDGTGQIVMRTAGDVEDARIVTYGWFMVNGANHTVRGEGAIHVSTQNQGTLQADVSGRALFIDGAVTNTGTARAAAEGHLEIPASFSNQGTAEAGTGGIARFGNVGPNYGDGGLHGGTWRVYDNSVMRLMGADIATLDANLLLDGPNSKLYRDDATTDALAPFATISGNGRLEIRNGRNLATPEGLANSGTLAIGLGSTMTVAAVFTQEGDATHGLTTVDGILSSPQAIQIHSGALDGTGTIVGGLVSSGDVGPGHSPGTLTVEGAYRQTVGGTLTIELAGSTAAMFDHLNATGRADLAGTLVVRAIDGFHPQVGDAFTIMTRGGGSGGFDAVVADLGPGLAAVVAYFPAAVTVTIVTPSGVEESDGPWDADGAAQDPTGALPKALKLSARGIDAAEATLVLDLPEAAGARIGIYDPSGRCVAVPVDRALPAGSHDWRWRGIADDGRRLPSGVYFVRADVLGPHGPQSRKVHLILLR